MKGREMSGFSCTLVLAVLLLMMMATLHTSSSQHLHPQYQEVFYSTDIEPLYDEYGWEVTEDQLLEMADMRSTSLGFGAGFNYTFPQEQEPPAGSTTSHHQPSVASQSNPPLPLSSPSSSPSSSVHSSSSQQNHYGPNAYAASSVPVATGESVGYTPFVFRRFKRQARYNRDNSIGDQVFTTHFNDDSSSNNNNNNNRNIFGYNTLDTHFFNGFTANTNNKFNDNNNNNFDSNSLRNQVFDTQTNPNQVGTGSSSSSSSSSRDAFQYDFPEAKDSAFSSSGTGMSKNLFLQGGTFGQFPSHTFDDGFLNDKKECAPEKAMQCDPGSLFRTWDGSCNNLANPRWGAINQPMRRLLPAVYFDGYDVARLTSTASPRQLLPSARLVSRQVHEPVSAEGSPLIGLTNLLQVWGQFLAHDITGTPAHKAPDGRDLKCCDGVYLSESQQTHRAVFDGGRCNPIYIPPQDRHFTYSCMNFARSVAAKRKRDCDKKSPREVRQQINMLTAWIDAGQVYGSTKKKADTLRLYTKGLLKVTSSNLLPEDTNSTCVREEPGDYCFLAGEKRANEHSALMALHIVFLRYHNEMARKLAHLNPRWSDEKIYQEARKVMGAIMQHVTYQDWLPVVLGGDVMKQYALSVLGAGQRGPSVWRYNSKMDPTIFNAFATAAFRFGHTMIPSLFTMGGVKVRLFTMFNRPKFILQNRGQGLGKMCSGMIHDPAQRSGRHMATDVTDRLFEDRHNVSMDLAALNIHRGRDHGLPPYMRYRELCGLPVYTTFEDLYRSEPGTTDTLRRVYGDVGDVDLFTGALSEQPLQGSVVGPTFACLLARQFQALKFADRFWYEAPQGPGAFTSGQLHEIRQVGLGRVMCKAAGLGRVAANPLYQAGVTLPTPLLMPSGRTMTRNHYVSCDDLPEIDFRHWYDPDAQI